jgi:hypothetical protein
MFGKWIRTIAMMMTAVSLAACTAETAGDDVLNEHARRENGGGAKVCPVVVVRCDVGYRLGDTNGDGCDDSCAPVACPAIMIDCAVGTGPADTDGDGCIDSCQPVVPPACPPVMFDCALGTGPADSDGDGCVDSCQPLPEL